MYKFNIDLHNFIFFKQKTAYEMLRSLVGSEMCIRDSDTVDADIYERCLLRIGVFEQALGDSEEILGKITPVSYTHLTLTTIYSV